MTILNPRTVSYEEKAIAAIRDLRRTGHPSQASKAQALLNARKPLNLDELYPGRRTVVPEVSSGGEVPEPPPRVGKGSGMKPWQKFASETSTIPPAVIKEAKKGDLIAMLEERGIIPLVLREGIGPDGTEEGNHAPQGADEVVTMPEGYEPVA